VQNPAVPHLLPVGYHKKAFGQIVSGKGLLKQILKNFDLGFQRLTGKWGDLDNLGQGLPDLRDGCPFGAIIVFDIML